MSTFLEGVRSFVIGVVTITNSVTTLTHTALTLTNSTTLSPTTTISQVQSNPIIASTSLHNTDYTLNGTYSYFGQSISYSISIPKKGGPFNGSIGGFCKATISGNYMGGNGGGIIGRAAGECNLPLLHYQGTINFKGNLYPESKILTIRLDNSMVSTPITIHYQ